MLATLPCELLLDVLANVDANTLGIVRQCSKLLKNMVDETIKIRKREMTRLLADLKTDFAIKSPSLHKQLEMAQVRDLRAQ